MSLRYFVDTSAWKALIDQKDQFHSSVREVFDQCRQDKTFLITSDYVVSETLTLLRVRAGLGHGIAIKFGELIHFSRAVQMQFISPVLFQKAWEIFRRYGDKDYSFVDCTSFALMEKIKTREAITLDHHFAQYGFTVSPFLPR